jgi:hypothetical protein
LPKHHEGSEESNVAICLQIELFGANFSINVVAWQLQVTLYILLQHFAWLYLQPVTLSKLGLFLTVYSTVVFAFVHPALSNEY